MSHITDVKMRVRNLESLAQAAEALGGTLVIGQKTHAWYGRFMNDSAEGRRLARERGSASFGTCEHAIRSKTHTTGDYEIGVVKALDGDGFDLVLDTWGPGGKLVRQFGSDLNGLRQEYAVSETQRKAKELLARKGFVAHRERLPNGSVRLRMVKR